jgi:hypothetical protein
MKNIVTRDFLKKNYACYYNEAGGEDKVNALVPANGLTAIQVARLEIPEQDRIWVLTRRGVLADSVLWEWASRSVERALARIKNPDPRSLAVIPLLRRLASGEKVPRAEIEALRAAYADAAAAAAAAAAYAADAAAAAYGAADAAADAAAAAAAYAAYAAAAAYAAYAAAAAYADAYAADAASARTAAAAAYAAYADAYAADAAAAAARKKERQQQIKDIINLLEQKS